MQKSKVAIICNTERHTALGLYAKDLSTLLGCDLIYYDPIKIKGRRYSCLFGINFSMEEFYKICMMLNIKDGLPKMAFILFEGHWINIINRG